MIADGGRRRVMIENVAPQVDCGRFPAKRVLGEDVVVEADVFTDGHDLPAATVLWRFDEDARWTERAMTPLGNDRWRAAFVAGRLGHATFTVLAWIDRIGTWHRDLGRKAEAGQDVAVELLGGAQLVREAAARAGASDAKLLSAWAARLADPALPVAERVDAAFDPEMLALARAHPDLEDATRYDRELAVCIEPAVALAGAWYELFPRSTARTPGQHGTFRDVEAQLPRLAAMGFDVLYLPPVHPIGRAHRKGRDNALEAEPSDPGSPWAIGAEEGGHTSVHPQLGTLEDFRRLVQAARERGLEIALDLAFQAAPDHPWVAEHPEWFRTRADGTVQYAENPPKKYEDILPFWFECEDWRGLWQALADVVRFWIAQGVSIFRVDNPHTKAFPFWEWLIREIRRDHSEAVFLAEAFTRSKVMYRLAKLGFSQSYSYFAWRNTKHELTRYFEELYRPPVVEFLRPNLWPNTPDILTEYLQTGGRAAFAARFVLAATLGASYGIYGPVYELLESEPREHGSEEYAGSEKYEIRHWDLDRGYSLEPLIARVNRIRRENPVLRRNRTLRFHDVDNEQLIAYSKSDAARGETVLVVVNLDPHHRQSGYLALDPEALGLESARGFQAHDMLSGSRFLWHGARHYVELDPREVPAHVFRVRRYVRTERDFEYYL